MTRLVPIVTPALLARVRASDPNKLNHRGPQRATEIWGD